MEKRATKGFYCREREASPEVVSVKRDLVSVKRDLVSVKRDLVLLPRFTAASVRPLPRL